MTGDDGATGRLPIASDERWQIQIGRDEVRRLAADPPFREVLKLGRAVNSLRTCDYLLIEEREEDFPVTRRLRYSAFVYVAALVYEAFELLRSHSRHLHELDAFDRCVRPLLRDKATVDFVNDTLRRIRNQGVFHFDDRDDTLPGAVAHLQDDPAVFAIGEGPTAGKVYNLLSDWALIHAALDMPAGPAETDAYLREIVHQIAGLSNAITTAGDWLIAEGLSALGWERADYSLGEVSPGPASDTA